MCTAGGGSQWGVGVYMCIRNPGKADKKLKDTPEEQGGKKEKESKSGNHICLYPFKRF